MTFKIHSQLETDSYLLGCFSLCQLRLINDQQYPWFILLPQENNISEIYQLTQQQQQELWRESESLSRIIMQIYQGDKLNIAAIGNLVPQLHLHHVVRFKNDPCWPKPVWGQRPMQAYSADEVQRIKQAVAEQIRTLDYQVSE